MVELRMLVENGGEFFEATIHLPGVPRVGEVIKVPDDLIPKEWGTEKHGTNSWLSITDVVWHADEDPTWISAEYVSNDPNA